MDRCSYGQDPISGFDCSGFIRFCLLMNEFPDDIPRHTSQMFDTFGILVHYEARRRGDLIYFSRDGLRPTHMGILISSSEYIHAPGVNNTNVEIKEITQKAIKWRSENQLYFTNPIGVKRLAVSSGRWHIPLD